jgi:anhydro-N-acetylmuramic acid kinase
MLAHPFFMQMPPKSLDRNAFPMDWVRDMSVEDGAATLVAFVAESVAKAATHFPKPVGAWYITGGGRHNRGIMNALEVVLNVPVLPVENLGYNGDAVEAQAYAYLAVRVLENLPISFPTTTGVRVPSSGGAIYKY